MTEEAVIDKAQEDKDAVAGFAAGFSKVRPAEKASPEASPAPEKSDDERKAEEQAASEKAKAETEAAEKAQAEAEAKAKAEAEAAEREAYDALPKTLRDRIEALESLPGTVSKLAGHIGGLAQATKRIEDALKAAKSSAEAAGGAAPSEKQVVAALADPEKWAQLKEDFPDWAGPVEAELAAIVARVEKVEKAEKAKPIDQDALVREAEERAYIRLKHPDWKTTVKTKDFLEWTLSEGPSLQAYAQMKELERTDPERAVEVRQAFAAQFPKWWEERGKHIFSDSGEGAVHMLDGYAAHRKKQADAEAERLKKEKRLAAAVVPEGSGMGAAAAGISDQEAFSRGYNRVAKGGK